MLFETERLLIRELQLEDAEALHAILGNEANMQFYPAPYSLEDCKEWIQRSRKSYEANQFGLWAVLLKSTQTFIGQCGISYQDIDGEQLPEIGYQFHIDHWHKGYATEAASACLDYGFNSLKLPEIYMHTYIKNLASQGVGERLGMQYVTQYVKYIPKHGVSWEHVVYYKQNPNRS